MDFLKSNLLFFVNVIRDIYRTQLRRLLVILFEIDFTIFYTDLHELFWHFISWTNWVNSGKVMDNCWISCQVMADMKKVYNNLIIINLYKQSKPSLKIRTASNYDPSVFKDFLAKYVIVYMFIKYALNIKKPRSKTSKMFWPFCDFLFCILHRFIIHIFY